MPEPIRAVIDPNVWISAIINPYGTPARVIEAVISGAVTAVVTRRLLDELAAVLIRPKFRRWITVADAVALVEALDGIAEVRPDPQSPPSQRVRDPDDDYLAALSEATRAVIVTGDIDLLDADLDPPAITPRQLLDTLTPP